MDETQLQALRETNPQDPRLPENQNLNPGPTDDGGLALLRESLQETNRRARNEEARRIEVENELAEYKRNQNRTPPAKFTAEQFFENPQAALSAEVSSQIAPLNEFAQEMRRERAYNQLKGRFLADNRFGSIVQQLGYSLDTVMAKLEPTEMNMVNAINTLIGQAYINNPEAFRQAPKIEEKKPEDEKKVPTPPHLRPSNTRSNGDPTKTPKTYTENERRMMRDNKMTEEQWEEHLNAPANLSGITRGKK